MPGDDADKDPRIVEARAALRRLLSGLHVLDTLPERSRILAVDAELPVHAVLSAVLREQHLQLPSASASRSGGAAGAAGGTPSWARPRGASESGGGGEPPGDAVPLLSASRREATLNAAESGGAPAAPAALHCGVVQPSLPSNVLAEVCEFDPGEAVAGGSKASAASSEAAAEPPPAEAGGDDEAKAPTMRRRWTMSQDDGWGAPPSLTMQDLEKMPMGMPVTVGELAGFLAQACDGASKPSGDGDMLDWTLAQWRAHRLRGADSPAAPAQAGDEPVSRLSVAENVGAVGPVLVHRVPGASPRPILCTDDPEASLLKVIELLLAYPELDALPVVSPVRCTVVAHLTLGYCLAFILSRLRGTELLPLSDLKVTADGGANGGGDLRVFDGKTPPQQPSSGAPAAAPPAGLWVMRQSQPLRDLLAFFSATSLSGVPVVENDDNEKVLGLLSRRDLLHFLDLSMQATKRRNAAGPAPEGAAEDGTQEDLSIDSEAPVEAMLKALRQHPRAATNEEDTSGPDIDFVFENEVPLRSLVLRVLTSDRRKVLFVSEGPRLRRIVTVSDVWRLLLGRDPVDDATN